MAPTWMVTTPDPRDDWHSLAHLLDAFENAARRASSGVVVSVDCIRQERKRLDADLEPIIEAVAGGGTMRGGLLTSAILDRYATSIAQEEESYPDHAGCFMPMKCVRYGFALATGDMGMVPTHERPLVRALLQEAVSTPGYRDVAKRALQNLDRFMAMDAEARSVPVEATAPGIVEFRYTWRPFSRHGKGDSRFADARAFAAIDRVDVADAPVAVSLRAGDGSDWLPIRIVDGMPMRPVLAPGSWRPVDLREFVEASRDGRAWADNAFQLRSSNKSWAHVGIDDIVTPVRWPHRRDGDARRKAEAACLRRAGRLSVIDGVVHRSTSMPRLHVVASDQRGLYGKPQTVRLSLGWSMGDVTSLPDPDLASWVGQGTFKSGADSPVEFWVDVRGPRRALDVGIDLIAHDTLVRAMALLRRRGRSQGIQVVVDPVVQDPGLIGDAELDELGDVGRAILEADDVARNQFGELGENGRFEISVRHAFAEALLKVVDRTTRSEGLSGSEAAALAEAFR